MLTSIGGLGEVHLEQRAALIRTTRLMAEHACAEQDVEKRSLYAIAATLCAHAAAEGILNEWLLHRDRAAYEKLVLEKPPGLFRLAALTLAMIRGTMPTDLAELSTHKNALTHPQPQHGRTRGMGAWLFGDGAQRSLAVVLDLEQQFFPADQAAPLR
jgi:hypothetical protein